MNMLFFGDSITLGTGDSEMLGWVGRIAQEMQKTSPTTIYNLGIRGETSLQIQHRWGIETKLRTLPNEPLKLIFSFGVADLKKNIPPAATLGAAIAISTQAKLVGDILFVGPTPIQDTQECTQILELSQQMENMCKQMSIPFISTIDTLQTSSVYTQSLAEGDGVHPSAIGYAEIAQLILQSETGKKFFGPTN